MGKADRRAQKRKRREEAIRKAKHERHSGRSAEVVDAGDGFEAAEPEASDEDPSVEPSGFDMERALRRMTKALDRRRFADRVALEAWMNTAEAHAELNGETGTAPETAQEEAQELAFQAMEAEDEKTARKLARRALALDPDCVDARLTLAFAPERPPQEVIGRGLHRAEVASLTTILDQALALAAQVKVDQDLFDHPRDGFVLVRTPSATAAGTGWESLWTRLPVPPRGPPNAPDGERLGALRATGRPLSGTWEVDWFLLDATVGEVGSTPWFPQVLLACDADTGLVLHHHLDRYDDPTLARRCLACLEEQRGWPELVRVRRPSLAAIFRELAKALGFAVEEVEALPAFDAARRGLDEHVPHARAAVRGR